MYKISEDTQLIQISVLKMLGKFGYLTFNQIECAVFLNQNYSATRYAMKVLIDQKLVGKRSVGIPGNKPIYFLTMAGYEVLNGACASDYSRTVSYNSGTLYQHMHRIIVNDYIISTIIENECERLLNLATGNTSNWIKNTRSEVEILSKNKFDKNSSNYYKLYEKVPDSLIFEYEKGADAGAFFWIECENSKKNPVGMNHLFKFITSLQDSSEANYFTTGGSKTKYYFGKIRFLVNSDTVFGASNFEERLLKRMASMSGWLDMNTEYVKYSGQNFHNNTFTQQTCLKWSEIFKQHNIDFKFLNYFKLS